MPAGKKESQITNHQSLERVSLLFAFFCISLCSGFLSGRLIINNESQISVQPDTRPLIPTLQITGIRNGLLYGSIQGSARISIGKTILTQSGVFAVDASTLLTNEIPITIPNGVQFVASTRGKKYYKVFSSAGEKITPKNRVYFKTEGDAERAGYEKSN